MPRGARQQYTVTDEQGEAEEIWALAVSPDGSTAAVGLTGRTIVLLDIESGQSSYPFAGHSTDVTVVTSLAFSPDGSLLLSGDAWGEVILWEVATGEEIQRFSGPTGAVYTLDFSPDGKTAVSGSFPNNEWFAPGELFLWDLETGEEIRRFEGGHSYGLRSAAISPDGQTLLSGELVIPGSTRAEAGSPLILWDMESGEIIHRFPAPLTHSESVVFHPDGRTAFALASNRIYQWDLETGEQIRDFEGHTSGVRMIDISPDGRRMISSDYGGGVILWDLVFGEPLARFAQAPRRTYVAFHPDGRTALSASQDGTVVLWDLFNANEIRRFEGHGGGVNEVAFTPDGRYILSAGGSDQGLDVPGVDNSIRIWEMETGEQVQILEGHEAGVYHVKVSPDGSKALTLSLDGAVIYWDLESGAELRRFDHPGTPFSIAFHPDGKRALIGTGEPSVLIWDLESGEVIDTLFGHEDWVKGLDVSPDGKTALSGDNIGNLILWDLESGQQLRRLSYLPRSSSSDSSAQLVNVIFSPDGSRALSQALRNVLVWDTGTWEILKSFNQNVGPSYEGMLALGPDGKTVASADIDGNVLVWDMERDEILHNISTSRRLPVYPEISPDGRYLLLGSQDHTVTLWDLNMPSLEELQAWIQENRHVRELTCRERIQHQVEPLCEETALLEPFLMPPVAPEAGYVQPVYQAQVGENRGEIALGEWDIWLYEGRAGEVLTVTLEADNPYTPGSSREERIELGEMDTWLFVISPDGTLMVMEDTHSIERVDGLVLPMDGTYQIQARSYEDSTAGAYTLIIEVEAEE